MERSESIKNLAVALAAFQAEAKPVPKDAVNPHFNSRYAKLETVMEVAQPLMKANGLSVLQTFEPAAPGELHIRTTLLHTSGEYFSGVLNLPATAHGKDANPQSTCSAITYGRRYALAAILGLVTDEDDDGEGAMARQQQNRSQRPSQPRSEAQGAKQGDSPTCPQCGSAMRLRKARNGGEFWGCSSYPECKKTLPHNEPDKGKADNDLSEFGINDETVPL